jgi:hypothetical protein
VGTGLNAKCAPDCSGTPNCSLLHRADCDVPRTCGRCLAGFQSAVAYGNDACAATCLGVQPELCAVWNRANCSDEPNTCGSAPLPLLRHARVQARAWLGSRP